MKGRPLLRPRDEAADEPTHERAEDAYERGGEEPHVIGARHDGPRARREVDDHLALADDRRRLGHVLREGDAAPVERHGPGAYSPRSPRATRISCARRAKMPGPSATSAAPTCTARAPLESARAT